VVAFVQLRGERRQQFRRRLDGFADEKAKELTNEEQWRGLLLQADRNNVASLELALFPKNRLLAGVMLAGVEPGFVAVDVPTRERASGFANVLFRVMA